MTHPEIRAEMAQEYHRELDNMRQAQAHDSGEEFALRAERPHPSLDQIVSEIWGHGTHEEMQALKSQKQSEYPEYTFRIVEE